MRAKPSRTDRSVASHRGMVVCGKLRELLDPGDLAGRVAVGLPRRHMAILAGLLQSAGAKRQVAVGRRAGAVVAERPLRIGRLLVNVRRVLPPRRIGRCTVWQLPQTSELVIDVIVDRRHAEGVLHRDLLRLLNGPMSESGAPTRKLPEKVRAKSGIVGIEHRLAFVDAGVLRRTAAAAPPLVSTMRWHTVQVTPSRASSP